MTTVITPTPGFDPAGRAHYDVAAPFLTLWLAEGVLLQVPATAEGRELLHRIADECRLLTLGIERNGIRP